MPQAITNACGISIHLYLTIRPTDQSLKSVTSGSGFPSPQKLRYIEAGAIGGTPGSPTPAGSASLFVE